MSALGELRIGCIGAGAMGEALLAGLLAGGVAARQLHASESDAARRRSVADALAIEVGDDNRALVERSDVVVIAVKPDRVADVLTGLADAGAAELLRPLWVSIAAGVTLERLAASLPSGARVIRAMPNTPALVRAGATAFVANSRSSAEDRAIAAALFESVGSVWEAPSEALLDAVTGLSGSGPAYVFVFLEALADAGVRMGIPREPAYRLAIQTVLGAARLAEVTGRHPGALKDQVTSPGGTTIAGLERLEARGFRAAVHEAVEAATRRSRELARA